MYLSNMITSLKGENVPDSRIRGGEGSEGKLELERAGEGRGSARRGMGGGEGGKEGI